MDIGESEDGDPELLSLLLQNDDVKQTINDRRRGKTFKWRCIHRLACILKRFNFASSGLMTMYVSSLSLSFSLFQHDRLYSSSTTTNY